MLGVGSDGGAIELRLVEEGGTFSADREAGAGHPGSGWVPVCWGARQHWGSLLCRSVVTDCSIGGCSQAEPSHPGFHHWNIPCHPGQCWGTGESLQSEFANNLVASEVSV